MIAHLNEYPSTMPNPLAGIGGFFASLNDNCATRTSSALEVGGLPATEGGITFPADAWVHASQYSEEVIIVRQGDTVPARFNEFNPK